MGKNNKARKRLDSKKEDAKTAGRQDGIPPLTKGCPIPDPVNCHLTSGAVSSTYCMECSYELCPYRGVPVHDRCLGQLEDHLVKILSTLGSARGWTDTQRRANLWEKKGQSLVAKHCRCPCGLGTTRLCKRDQEPQSYLRIHEQPNLQRVNQRTSVVNARESDEISNCDEEFVGSSGAPDDESRCSTAFDDGEGLGADLESNGESEIFDTLASTASSVRCDTPSSLAPDTPSETAKKPVIISLVQNGVRYEIEAGDDSDRENDWKLVNGKTSTATPTTTATAAAPKRPRKRQPTLSVTPNSHDYGHIIRRRTFSRRNLETRCGFILSRSPYQSPILVDKSLPLEKEAAEEPALKSSRVTLKQDALSSYSSVVKSSSSASLSGSEFSIDSSAKYTVYDPTPPVHQEGSGDYGPLLNNYQENSSISPPNGKTFLAPVKLGYTNVDEFRATNWDPFSGRDFSLGELVIAHRFLPGTLWKSTDIHPPEFNIDELIVPLIL